MFEEKNCYKNIKHFFIQNVLNAGNGVMIGVMAGVIV